MTQTDISLLLADAADEVEIGIAPVQAVLRGGRRRRARRWAVAAATTLVLAGSAGGTLAVTGLPGGDTGNGHASVATRPPTPAERHVYAPLRTQLAAGTERGERWTAAVELWGAPRDKAEATRQLAAMTRKGFTPVTGSKASALIGKTSYFVVHSWGGGPEHTVIFNTAAALSPFVGTDLEAGATRFASGSGSERTSRLVIGQVAGTARQVRCTWEDGSSSLVVPRAAAGFRSKWFVCVAPQSTSYDSAEVVR